MTSMIFSLSCLICMYLMSRLIGGCARIGGQLTRLTPPGNTSPSSMLLAGLWTIHRVASVRFGGITVS
ncbi:hypothetical protein PF005_g27997 [Phytophthora fragariae]|uniref:Secreted protein n=1 Tax=Phytophthora fragariae TaxID=53985 RepID=A0A6A3DH72_9STRA|nr:hypothetical protein PF009_g31792 [Phytophthora fragariae]KAE9056361.1 hypothetical protein PF006_g32701 [Phytophthora fragariae]KAE9085416.1 hypothetical protein PF010_g20464 [Phytophthora fragariae]KAE9159950.1 hypothetical protein PF002_g32742 [Phytophthora fragariae]KAE9169382.1 hypothetical protein PF005_g27997 [Phytophthora fragariae]